MPLELTEASFACVLGRWSHPPPPTFLAHLQPRRLRRQAAQSSLQGGREGGPGEAGVRQRERRVCLAGQQQLREDLVLASPRLQGVDA